MNTSAASPSVLALSGGIGGAKLALGLTQAMPPESLLIVGNIGDDFEHLGLHVSPDLDTLMYTLSGKADPEKGWGLASESWAFMQALEALGGETWFQLGDGDLATHVERTRRLRAGESLTEITSDFCRSGFRFQGADAAQPNPLFWEALRNPSLQAVVVCPSNPFLSIDPILAVRGVREALRTCSAPVIAVSPLVGGDAVKGPTAKNLRELGHPVSATTVANYYRDFLDGFVVDTRDKATVPEIEKLGLSVEVTDTLMTDLASKAALAKTVLAFAQRCRAKR